MDHLFANMWPGQKVDRPADSTIDNSKDGKLISTSFVSLESLPSTLDPPFHSNFDNPGKEWGRKASSSTGADISDNSSHGSYRHNDFYGRPLSRDQWMKDSHSLHCYNCEDEFWALNRRHHCRRCGRVFCGKCSQKTISSTLLKVKGSHSRHESSDKLRVCDHCYNEALGLPQKQTRGSQSKFSSKQSWNADMIYVNGTMGRDSWYENDPTGASVSLPQKEEPMSVSNQNLDAVKPMTEEHTVGSPPGPHCRTDEEEDDDEEEYAHNTDGDLAPSKPSNQSSSVTERRRLAKARKREFNLQRRQERQARYRHSIQAVDTSQLSAEGFGVHHGSASALNSGNFREGESPPVVKLDGESEARGDEEDTDCGMGKYYVNQEAERHGGFGDKDTCNTKLWIPPPAEFDEDERMGSGEDGNGDSHAEEEENESRNGTFAEEEVDLGDIREQEAELDRLKMHEVVDGHFRALVEQMLRGDRLPCASEGSGWLDIVVDLALTAASLVKPDTSKGARMDPGEYVKVKCIASGDKSSSRVLDGVVCRKNVANRRMVSDIQNPNILILSGSLEYQRSSTQLSSMETLLKQERSHLEHILDQVSKRFPKGDKKSKLPLAGNVLLVEKTVAGFAQDKLLEKGASLVLNVKQSLLDRISRCTGAQVLSASDTLSTLGGCRRFHTARYTEEHYAGQDQKKPSKTLMFFEGCPLPLGCTVLLMGAGTEELKKVKRIVQYAVFAAYHLALETSFLSDEGALPKQMSLANFPHHSGVELPALPAGAKPDRLPLSEWNSPGKIAMLSATLRRSSMASTGSGTASPVQQSDETKSSKPDPWQKVNEKVEEKTGEGMGVGMGVDLPRVDSGAPRVAPDPDYATPTEAVQTILVSVSSRCLPKKMVCDSPKLRRIKYYGDSDMPLGLFLLQDLFNKENHCKVCDKTPEAHVKVYTHKEGSLTISVRRVQPPLPGTDDHIWLWHRCKRCVKIGGLAPATNRVIMSEAARKLSFGKFLELSFSNHAAASRVAACGHSLHRDCLRFYGCQDMIACFSYAPMTLHTVHLPSPVLQFNPPENQQWLKDEVAQVVQQRKQVFDKVLTSLQVLAEGLLASPLAPGNAFGTEVKRNLMRQETILRQEMLQLDEKLGIDRPAGSRPTDILSLNEIRREIAMIAVDWEKRFTNLKQQISQQRKQASSLPAVDNSPAPEGHINGGSSPALEPSGIQTPPSDSGTDNLGVRIQSYRDTGAPSVQAAMTRALSMGDLPLWRDLSHEGEANCDLIQVQAVEVNHAGHDTNVATSTAPEASIAAETAESKSEKGPIQETLEDQIRQTVERVIGDLESSDNCQPGKEKSSETRPLREPAEELTPAVKPLPEAEGRMTAGRELMPVSRTPSENNTAGRELMPVSRTPSENNTAGSVAGKPGGSPSRNPLEYILDRAVEIVMQHSQSPSRTTSENDSDKNAQKLSAEKLAAEKVGSGALYALLPSRRPSEVGSEAREAPSRRASESGTVGAMSRRPSENALLENGCTDPDSWGTNPGFVWTWGLVQSPSADLLPPAPDHGGEGAGMEAGRRERKGSFGRQSETDESAEEKPPEVMMKLLRPIAVAPAAPSQPSSPTKSENHDSLAERPKTPALRPVPGSVGLPPLATSVGAKFHAEGSPHVLLPLGVNNRVIPIYDDEPTSFIAYALSTEEFKSAMSAESDRDTEHAKEGDVALSGGHSLDERDDSHSDCNDRGIRKLVEVRDQPKVSVTSIDARSKRPGSPAPGRNAGDGDAANPLLSSSQLHVKVQFPSDETPKKRPGPHFTVTCYYAKQFEALRKFCCGGEEGQLEFIRSLCRSKKWATQGGKSAVYFAKTLDDRFVIKQVQRKEMVAFLDFARDYFKYLFNSFARGNPSCLAKILGLFQVTIKGTTTNLMVMENLLYNRKISCIYDLKGSIRSRYNANVSDPNAVLLDENLLGTMATSPIFVGKKSKQLLERAVWNDTKFLADMDVMDYSMLVGVEESSHDLVIGIIDFIRPYTWDKQLETWVKASGILGGPRDTAPTIISPDSYKSRFRKAMKTYFVVVPDQLTPPPVPSSTTGVTSVSGGYGSSVEVTPSVEKKEDGDKGNVTPAADVVARG